MHPSMEALRSSFISTTTPFQTPSSSKPKPKTTIFFCSVTSDPNSDSMNNDDKARRIIKGKARYLSELRRDQGSCAHTPKWIKRTPEQMVRYLEDDRNGHLYGKHVVAAIQRVRSLSRKPQGSYDMRQVMASFVAKLTFREMCTVLKEQKSWRQATDFFAWMKLQLSYQPSVIAYTIVLRIYGQVGKIKLAEQMFLEMLEAGCEPDEIACGTMLCAYARWGHHKAMLAFYSAVQERGIMLPISVFNFMLSSLQKKSLHGNVAEMWRQMVNKGAVPNHFTYTVVISSFVKEGFTEEAFKMFSEMKNLGFLPEEATYSLLINLSCKYGNRDEALRLYEDMRSQGIVASNYTWASLLNLHYKNGDHSKAVSLFLEMERNKVAADEVIYGLLIKIYGKLGLYEDAERTFDEIKKLGLLSDEKTYIAMAQVHLNSGDFEKALSTMEQMRSGKIWFSRFAYIVLLQCYIMKEDLVSAEVTYQALSKTGPPDTGSCNNMLNLYMRRGLTEMAKDFVTRIRKQKVEFDEELLKTVMNVYCKEGLLGDAARVIEETSTSKLSDSKFVQAFLMVMHGESRRPTKAEDSLEHLDQSGALAFELMLLLYLAVGNSSKTEETLKLLLQTANGLSVASQLVSKLIKEGDCSKAEHLYKLLIELGCILEHVTSASMISFYGKQQKLKQAREVFEMVVVSNTNAKQLYTAMIDAYGKSGQLEAAFLFYKEVSEKGHDLGAVAISMLVNALISGGKYREAENVIHSSIRNNLDLDTVAYNTFIKALLQAGKLRDAANIYECMLSSGVLPSLQTYSIMISVYGQGRNLNKAVEMFNMARSTGVSMDEKAYSNLISCYGKAGKVHEASHMFSKMQEEGIKPGKVSYNTMMNVYATAGLYGEATKLFLAMEKDGCLPDSLTYLDLVRAYTKGLKYSEAEQAIVSMQKRGIPPSCAHFNLLLSAFAKAGLIREAERVYGELIEAGLRPDPTCYRAMLRGYIDYGHVEEGISLLETLLGSVEPDGFIMSAAVHFYKSAGMEPRAEEILKSMNSLGIPFLEKLEVGSKTESL
ncbi:Pentatricopeptide repeat-containing protein [Actinidia chinensis var. chinensis]|uniref:Pentatricopeptide repeat-containing protein n=1 Tax=Actinidia chinensis var. chinensis TaxID=1590841 RepID=A0A2R6RQE7_ACTCC|nr:Pentatricopeptide repeat-containing protein [Actinidia chinensis var. chinensis]